MTPIILSMDKDLLFALKHWGKLEIVSILIILYWLWNLPFKIFFESSINQLKTKIYLMLFPSKIKEDLDIF